MNNTERFLALQDYFTDEKKFIGNGNYRLRKIDEENYDFEFSLIDPCGAGILNPQIRLTKQGEDLKPVQLFDMGSTPVKFLKNDSEESARELNIEFEKLIEKFENAMEKL
ncbi:MAG: hypothetical protein LBD38_00770 [Streptococcaceae bacterium]|jgi:hypothetical protein|nr:hypothetical protein [Streptococcaceae bacterium]